MINDVNDYRSSHRSCSVINGVLRNFTKFTGKHLCQSLSFNKVAGVRPAILLKKRLWHRCFPVNFAKFLRTPFQQNTSWRLLLLLHKSVRNCVCWNELELDWCRTLDEEDFVKSCPSTEEHFAQVNTSVIIPI